MTLPPTLPTRDAAGNSAGMLPAVVEFEPRFCGNHVVDLTVGCSLGCVYCPFAPAAMRTRGVDRVRRVDMSSLERLEPPASVFLSPSSDPFAPQAAAHTHLLLSRWLPLGVVVGLVTKAIVPEYTLDLLADHRDQVEGIGVGLASLDEERNRALEPGCPSANQRLANVDRIAARGLAACLRIDPMLPGVDDSPGALEALVDQAAQRGAHAISATYLFAWGRTKRRLRRIAAAARAVAHLTERSPMEGGVAYSVPLSRKMDTYSRIAGYAARRGLQFSTCGCKDLRLRDASPFPSRCRNVAFLVGRALAGATPGGRGRGSADAAPGERRALRPAEQRRMPVRRTTGP